MPGRLVRGLFLFFFNLNCLASRVRAHRETKAVAARKVDVELHRSAGEAGLNEVKAEAQEMKPHRALAACTPEAARDWRQQGFMLVTGYEMSYKIEKGHALLACRDEPTKEFLISCDPRECGKKDAVWCFIKKNWWNGVERILNVPVCQRQEPLKARNKTVVVRVNSAKLTRELDGYGYMDMDPFAVVRLGVKSFVTPALIGAGSRPRWRFERELLWEGEPKMRLSVQDQDWSSGNDVIGNTTVDMFELESKQKWAGELTLYFGNASAGTLDLEIHWKKSYELLQEKTNCNAEADRLMNVKDVEDCANKVEKHGGKYFGFGGNASNKQCLLFHTKSRSCKTEEGSGGFTKDSSLNFYGLVARTKLGSCERMTGRACTLTGCHGGSFTAGSVQCIEQMCVCKEGFCFNNQTGSCEATCKGSEAAQKRLTPEQAKTAERAVEYLQAGGKGRDIMSMALQNLSSLGESVSNHVDLVGSFLDFGLNWDYMFKSFIGNRFGNTGVGQVLQLGYDNVMMVADLVSNYGTQYVAIYIMGAACQTWPLTCLGLTVGVPSLVGKGAGYFSALLYQSKVLDKKTKYDLESSMVRGNATRALRMLGSCGSAYAPSVALQLADRYPEVRRQALRTLEAFGDAAVPFAADVALVLSDPEYSVREQAKSVLKNLGEVAQKRAAADLVYLIDSGVTPTEKMVALRSLAMLEDGATPYLDRVAQCLGDAEINVRQAAAQVMAMVGPSAAKYRSVMIKHLNDDDEDEFVRGYCAVALKHTTSAEERKQNKELIEAVFPEGLPDLVIASTGEETREQRAVRERLELGKAMAEEKLQKALGDLNAAEDRAEHAEMKALELDQTLANLTTWANVERQHAEQKTAELNQALKDAKALCGPSGKNAAELESVPANEAENVQESTPSAEDITDEEAKEGA